MVLEMNLDEARNYLATNRERDFRNTTYNSAVNMLLRVVASAILLPDKEEYIELLVHNVPQEYMAQLSRYNPHARMMLDWYPAKLGQV